MPTISRVIRVPRKHGDDRWRVVHETLRNDAEPLIRADRRSYLTRRGAIHDAATSMLVHDPRYLALVETFNTERGRILAEYIDALDAESEPES